MSIDDSVFPTIQFLEGCCKVRNIPLGAKKPKSNTSSDNFKKGMSVWKIVGKFPKIFKMFNHCLDLNVMDNL